jgi:tRNA threonylcarbamoyl adenosine modification protein YeaZ
VIFVIDTSSAMTAFAVIDESGVVEREEVFPTIRNLSVADHLRALAGAEMPARVAVATGPGSFTGLRVGVSFGLGLAMGLRIPIVPLPTLDLQAARSDEPATAVSEAGRGRVYYQLPGGEPALGEPREIPNTFRLVGWVATKTEAALEQSDHVFRPDHGLRTFGQAAAKILEKAREVAYGRLKLEYMQSFASKSI